MKRLSTTIRTMGFLLCNLFIAGVALAQEPGLTETQLLRQRTSALEDAAAKLNKLKVSGYIQAQYQWGQEGAALKVGGVNTDPAQDFNRIGVRRGRIKFVCEEGIASGVFQIDMTDKGIGFKDVYLQVKDPWVGTNLLKAGVFDRPFGFEIGYSSSRRESPERSTLFQTLFPDERDLGGALTLQASKTSPWNFLKLEAGLFAGNGIKPEIDNKRDLIGHLSATGNIGGDGKWGLGASYYYGYVIQGNANVYTMRGDGFVLNDEASNKGGFAKRRYVGFDGQFHVMSPLGMTCLRAEYIFGIQPAGPASSKSPNGTAFASLTDTYIRDFQGGYAIFVQDFGKAPLSGVVKYDWYDPNTRVSGDQIGKNGTNAVDLSQNTLGFGLLWRAGAAIRLTAYYEVNKNETTQNLDNFKKDVKNDVFTLRLQYKF